MKKVYVFFTMIFVIVANTVFAQDSQENFIIKKEKNKIDGKTYLNYLDPARKEHYPLPKAAKGQFIEVNGKVINSREKLNQIELKIFKPEEIKYLGKNGCVATCIVSTSGKIISVSFAFVGWEPEVPVDKLQEYAAQIKENITIEYSFSPEPVQEGYLNELIVVFRSLNPPKNVKSKVGN
jgi:hypothetical protein